MSLSPQRIVQISDLHIYNNPDQSLLGVKTEESFKAVFEALKQDPHQPSVILLNGDLSQDGTVESYDRINKIFSSLDVPVYCTPGNHDDSTVMNKIYPKGSLKLDKLIQVSPKWVFLLLDSHQQGKVEGFISEAEISFMEKSLKIYQTCHVIIMFHHHPVAVGSAWLDPLGVKNAKLFWEKVKKYSNVHSILFSHVHQECSGEYDGIPYYSTPSTCIQFKPESAEFALEKSPPGYRWIDLYPNGDFKTGITRIENYVGFFDEKAKGY